MHTSNQLANLGEYAATLLFRRKIGFFLQVKTTEAIARPGSGIRAKFSAREVRLVQSRKVPVYLAAVLSMSDGQEEIYVIGIDAAQRGGLSVVPRLFPLSEDEVRMAIYREENAFFASGLKPFESGLTRRRVRAPA